MIINQYYSLHRKVIAQSLLFLPIHHDRAAGNGKQWMSARGWTCYTSRGQTAGDHYKEYVLNMDEKMQNPESRVRLPAFEYHQHIPRQEYRITVRNDFLFTPLNQQDQSVGI